ncbi:pseudaminic acid synthase [Paenibacillus sp. PAMC21692]|uniref:pseudaminic acid synthase n=1 Tax=Paenibacillus sp. PAMC21692 TaxID=2762320 RepID=UPI00164DDC8E|nr:pseudaminic acid synthase [Paenibacillus sp. PAMC21692]QNK58380.1 pseudaminic acid synthase [Paenibacillus sp. PAMC21692]
MDIQIGNRLIGKSHNPFLIAEMSGNHNQSLDRALLIVEAAAASGADALKLQTYTADTMTLDIHEGDFYIEDPNSLWKGESLYNLYKEAYTPWEWHEAIFQRANELGMLAFSTPFDETAVEFLESLNVPAYKIASFENTDIQLIRKVAATKKPLIISTGMATIAELDETVREARAAGAADIVLLKCTSTYPASPENSNLATLSHMEQLFECQVGLSDHTMGTGVAVAAVALGATVVEKHFTLSRAEGGVDSAFSMEPAEFASLVSETERAWQALGGIRYGATVAEQATMKHRRSLYISRDMKAGETFAHDNIKAIRPGLGLPTKYLDNVIGRVAAIDLRKGTPLSWDCF